MLCFTLNKVNSRLTGPSDSTGLRLNWDKKLGRLNFLLQQFNLFILTRSHNICHYSCLWLILRQARCMREIERQTIIVIRARKVPFALHSSRHPDEWFITASVSSSCLFLLLMKVDLGNNITLCKSRSYFLLIINIRYYNY